MSFLVPVAAEATATTTTAAAATTATTAGLTAADTAFMASAASVLTPAASTSTFSSILSGVSTALTAYSALSIGVSGAKASASNAAMANFNRMVAARNSAQALAAADAAAKEQRRDTMIRIGAIRSAYASSGVVTTSGSPLLTVAEQAAEGETDAQKILYKGQLTADGFDAEAAIQSLVVRDEQKKASSATQNSVIKAGAILTGRSLLS